MLHLIFKKIDKSKYPKIARKWSFSALLIFPVFVIVNKLWPFLYLYIILNLINFLLIILNAPVMVIDVVSFVFYIVIAFYTFFLVLYGRVLAWQKLGYENTEKDIAKFKLRQRIVCYINIVIIAFIVIYLLSLLEYGHWMSVYQV